jgi:hypothetical protein
MKERSKLTLSGLIIIIAVIAFWLLIIFPVLEKVKRISQKVVCGTNLKGLGTAITVYSNDYDDNYPQLPGNGPWAKELGFPYYLEKPDFETTQSNTPRTISSSLYLLVREADVHPKSFVCPWADQTEFDNSNPNNSSFVDLWDFGIEPYKHVSYSYHNPYGKFSPNGFRSAAFAVSADMNPWFQDGNIVPPGKDNLPPQVIKIPAELLNVRPWKTEDLTLRRQQNQELRELWKPSNSTNELPHRGPLEKKAKYAEGQNVLFGDGHSSWEKQPNVGVKYDNIYTYWSVEEDPSEQDKQGGTAPTGRSPENDAKSEEDSFLVL